MCELLEAAANHLSAVKRAVKFLSLECDTALIISDKRAITRDNKFTRADAYHEALGDVERQLCKLEVRGSNPLASSLRSPS